eukprot:g32212.t1
MGLLMEFRLEYQTSRNSLACLCLACAIIHILSLNNPELRKAEQEHLYGVFKRNGYPKSTICCYLRDRPQQEDITQPDSLITLPYIKDISEVTTDQTP